MLVKSKAKSECKTNLPLLLDEVIIELTSPLPCSNIYESF